jgi:hypothetical protein
MSIAEVAARSASPGRPPPAAPPLAAPARVASVQQ